MGPITTYRPRTQLSSAGGGGAGANYIMFAPHFRRCVCVCVCVIQHGGRSRGGGCQSVTTLSSGLPRHEMTSAVNVALNKHSTNQRGGGCDSGLQS